MKTKFKNAVKEFFYQSFRRHSRDEYAELFTRGFKGEGENTVYPWFYLRVFAVLAVVYALYAVMNSALPGAGTREAFYFVGAAFMDVAFLVLLFELYPRRDISLLTLLCVFVAGGSFADLLASFLYYFHGDVFFNGWKLAAVAGVGEEIVKAVPSFVCILLLKKKDCPAAGFLIGAAVGSWFSLTENASYIHSEYTMGMMVLTATARACGCIFSHAVWTALISWAFCKFGKPFISLKFYGVVIFCMAMHFCIDMPLEDYLIILFAEAAVCGIASMIFWIVVIHRERKTAAADAPKQACPALTYVHKLNITSAAFGCVLCAMLLVFSALFSNTTTVITEYTAEDFVSLAQNGCAFKVDEEREYDENIENYVAHYEQGKLTVAHQLVNLDGAGYVYCYNLFEPAEYSPADGKPEETYTLSDVYVLINENGKEVPYYRETLIYGGESLSYFRINDELPRSAIFKDGKVQVIRQDSGPDAPSIALICVSATVAVGWAVTYFTLKRKYARLENLQLSC